MPPRTAHPGLADWLDTAPVPLQALRRALVIGEPADADLVAAQLPAARVAVADRPPPAGARDRYDFVAVVDPVPAGRAPADLAAAARAVASDGLLLVLSGTGSRRPETAHGQPWDPATAGMRLVAFDDLTEARGADDGEPRRWQRATFRRASR
jgi:hypothetical protein